MNKKQRLFDLAINNNSHIESLYSACVLVAKNKGHNQPEVFSSFISRKGRVSINFRLTDCLAFLTSGQHRNIYELAQIKAQSSGQTAEHELRLHLGKYFPKRKGLNDAFEDEELFRYGALNAGGVGAFYYGDYCAVQTSDFLETETDVAYIKSDSLNQYVDSSGKVAITQLAKELASESHKCRLATIKHNDDITKHQEESWSRLMCHDKTYIEVVFFNSFTSTSLQCVRISKRVKRNFEELAYKSVTKGLDDNEKIRSDSFIVIQDFLRNHNILLEVV